jgi:hypothetical protein
MTWLRKLPDLHWFDLGVTSSETVEEFVHKWLAEPSGQSRLES